MPTHRSQISLADLSAVGLRLRPSEGATIARDVALRIARGEFPGMPTANVLRLTADGRVQIEGPVGSGREIERAARLLEALLPGFDAPPEVRVPGALRLVLARALGTLELPAYESLEEFADALSRFAVTDVRACVLEIYGAWSAAASPASESEGDEHEATSDGSVSEVSALTISDLRRARRATRLTLADISDRTQIPVTLLREFEWGYFANWPSGFHGRSQIVRYARAAGLDEDVVVETVLPMLEQQPLTGVAAAPAPTGDAALVRALASHELEPFAETDLVPIAAAPLISTRRRGLSRGGRWAAALAIPALLAIGVAPAVWSSWLQSERPPIEAPPVSVAPPIAAPASAGASEQGPKNGVLPRSHVRDGVAPPAGRAEVASAGFSPGLATVGSAMFDQEQPAQASGAVLRAENKESGAVLRVTSIVNDRAQNFHARPSPDGRRIAFDSDRDGERGVYVADASGDNVHRVTGEGFAAVPSWSPDGRRLAFVRAEADRPKVWNLWTIDVVTGEMRRVTSHRAGQPWGAAWFPDGQRIAYSNETRLIVRALDGSSERVFPSPVPGRGVRTPAVSPDGQRIMFQVSRNGAWLLDLRDGSMRRVLADPSAEEFAWSPDGRRVAYHSRRSGTWGVWVMLS
jgi:hypothetical protein